MNIFVLSLCPKQCAKFTNDKHVVKMILESAQMLCTTHHLCCINPDSNIYKIAHKNHPCTIWTRETKANYSWLYLLFRELCKEYTYRYLKIHKCETKLMNILNNIPELIPEGNMTIFKQFFMTIGVQWLHIDIIIDLNNFFLFYFFQNLIKSFRVGLKN